MTGICGGALDMDLAPVLEMPVELQASQYDITCSVNERKVFLDEEWQCERCPAFTRGDGELSCYADTCS